VKNYIKEREELREDEIKALRKMNLGYGRFIDNVRRLGMPANTFRYIVDRGHGNRRNVNKIRAILLPHLKNESHIHQPAENTAG
jgi:hypothetical protein